MKTFLFTRGDFLCSSICQLEIADSDKTIIKQAHSQIIEGIQKNGQMCHKKNITTPGHVKNSLIELWWADDSDGFRKHDLVGAVCV